MIKDLQTFLNEKSGELHKVIMCVSTELTDFKYVTDKSTYTKNFMQIFTKGDQPFKADMPVINFCNIHTQRLLDAGTPKDLIYNPKEKKMEIASKVKWHETHKDSKHVPKTVSEPEDLDQLKFPIIAKPDNRYSGMGIQKFDTLEDAKKADLEDFEVFSEKIDIDEEHRIMMWRGEPVMWVQRVHGNKETKEMTKKKEDKLYFKYVLKNLDKLPEEWNEVFQEMNETHENLDLYSIDLMVDTDGKPWVVEMSSEFAPLYGVMAPFYKKVYQDYYGKKLNPTDEKEVDTYQQKDITSTIDFDKKRFSVE
tara:strand:- start:6260 stop:7183 length:924 start_codon:yes stop_codon:yes gene_type:complete